MKNNIVLRLEQKLQNVLNNLNTVMSNLAVKNTSSEFLKNIVILYYNKYVKLHTIANIINVNANKIIIVPFDISLLHNIEKSLIELKSMFTIYKEKFKIIVIIPVLTTQKRRYFVKKVKHESEKSKIIMRTIKKNIDHEINLNKKNNCINLDKDILALYNIYVKKVIRNTNIKENEIMTM